LLAIIVVVSQEYWLCMIKAGRKTSNTIIPWDKNQNSVYNAIQHIIKRQSNISIILKITQLESITKFGYCILE